MASCDVESNMVEATAQGWRRFRMRLESDANRQKEVVCPASQEAGSKTQMPRRVCGGLSSKAKANIVIVAHGNTAAVRKYRDWRDSIDIREAKASPSSSQFRIPPPPL